MKYLITTHFIITVRLEKEYLVIASTQNTIPDILKKYEEFVYKYINGITIIIYFRIIVPFSFGDSNTLTITAFWDEDFNTSPLWMFLRAGSSLPTTKTFDKQ